MLNDYENDILCFNRFYPLVHDSENLNCEEYSDYVCTPEQTSSKRISNDTSKDCNDSANKCSSKKLFSENGFVIACLNVRGVLCKIDEIMKLLNETDIDVLGLCETFLDENVDASEYAISGYKVVTRHRNRHGGGVLFYIKEGVRFQVIDLNVSNNVESLWIKIQCVSVSVALGVVYRPPSANVSYYDSMLDQLDHIHAHYDKVILMGDLNYNYLSENYKSSNNHVHNIESLYGMSQLVNDPTRVTLTTSTLLDVILSNIPECHVKTGIYDISLSDHYMVYTTLHYPKAKSKHNTVRFRDYKSFNENEFLNTLRSCKDITDMNCSKDEF